MSSDLARRVRAGVPLRGALVPVPGELLVEEAGRAGLDFVVLEVAPGEPGHPALRHHLAMAAAHSLGCLVRVADPAEATVALEAGAAGVVLAPTATRPHAQAVVQVVRAAWSSSLEDAPLVVATAGPALGVDAGPGVPALEGVDVWLSREQGPVDPGVRVMAVCADEASARAQLASGRLVLYDMRTAIRETFSRLGSGTSGAASNLPWRLPEEAEPLVLLPGMLGTATTWDAVAACLLDVTAPRVARIDLDDSVGQMAQTVLAQAPEHFALAGHSLGGIVSLEIVRRAPHRVTRLALCNTSARDGSPEQQGAWSELRRRLDAEPFDRLGRELGTGTLPEGRRDDADLVDAVTSMALAVGPDGLSRQLAAQSTRPDSRPHLARITVPTLVLTGEQDQVCPGALQEELAAGIPEAVHAVVDAGHMAPLERPQAVAEHLREWLVSAPRGRSGW